MDKAQERAMQAYPSAYRIGERAAYEMGYEQAIRDLLEGAAPGRVFNNCDPASLYVKNEDWAALLGQLENGSKVQVIIIPNEEKTNE